MPDILDESLRNWIATAMSVHRTERLTVRTTPQVMEYLRRAAKQQGLSVGRVVHLAILFGLAALTKYWEEQQKDGGKDEL